MLMLSLALVGDYEAARVQFQSSENKTISWMGVLGNAHSS